MLPPFLTRRRMIGSTSIITAALPTAAQGVDLKDFGAREGQNIAPALSRALEAGGGAPIFIGPGEFHLDTAFVYRNRDKFESSSRAPGLILIGSGSRRTVINCTAAGEAAIEVAQERPFRFTLGGRLEGFTLNGNPRAAKQDGIRLSGAWNYTITDVEVTGFTGNGLSIPWREDLHWELKDVEIVAGSKQARRSRKGGLSDAVALHGGLRIFGEGIATGATIERMIDENTVEMSAPATQSGTRSLRFVGNVDAFQSLVEVRFCRFLANRGWGLWGGAGIAALITWEGTEAALNGTGGVFCGGNGWNIAGGAIYSNEGVGLVVDRVSGGPTMLNVERIEFDSNKGGHVWLKEIRTASFERCRFISHYLPSERSHVPEVGFIIGNSPATRLAHGVILKGCQFRAPPDEPAPYSAIRFGATGGYRHIEVLDSPWITRAPHHRLFEGEPDPATNVLVREDGVTTYASRTARAWAILEKGPAQRIGPNASVELLFERLQGSLAGGASVQRILKAKAVAGSNQLELNEAVRGLKAGLPVTALGADALAQDSTIVGIQGKSIQISTAATTGGEFELLVGGLRTPYAQVYEIDASVTLEGVTPGSTIELAVTVAGQIVRKSILAAGTSSRQSATIRALLQIPAGARIGLTLRQDGRADVSAIAGPLGGALSMIAAT